jgi:hypothetical protein
MFFCQSNKLLLLLSFKFLSLFVLDLLLFSSDFSSMLLVLETMATIKTLFQSSIQLLFLFLLFPIEQVINIV